MRLSRAQTGLFCYICCPQMPADTQKRRKGFLNSSKEYVYTCTYLVLLPSWDSCQCSSLLILQQSHIWPCKFLTTILKLSCNAVWPSGCSFVPFFFMDKAFNVRRWT